MESKPSRAKRRISSRPSQGFMERLRRSTLCALVSWAVFVIICDPLVVTPNPVLTFYLSDLLPICSRLFLPENEKTHRQIALGVGYKCRYFYKLLRSATSPRQS